MNSNKTITATFLEVLLPPIVTLNSPADGSTVTSSPIEFNCTCIDDGNLHNVTLYTGQATPITPGNISVRVNAGSDDAEERISTGAIDLTSTDLELCYDSFTQIVGTRFTDVQIPQGATITNAYVEFECDDGQWIGNVPIQIKGQDIDNAPTFTTTAYSISTRAKTDTIVSWTITEKYTTDYKYRSADISSIIQEIVDRSGWASRNSVVIIFNSTSTNKREMESYNGEATAAPRLVVNFTTGGNITWTAQETKTITGTTNTTTFSTTLVDGEYKWNCLAYDEEGNSAFASSAYDLTVNTSIPPIYYTLTTNVVGNGVINPSGGTYLIGTVVSVEAIPDSGWQFDHWSGNLSGTDNTTNCW